MNDLLSRLQIDLPIIQAPMAGVSTPAMAAAVSNAGALGSIAIGAESINGAKKMIAATQQLTTRSLNINVFCHATAPANPAVESKWIDKLRSEFALFGGSPPEVLEEIYKSFAVNHEVLELLVQAKPKVVSFHFGLPSAEQIRTLHDTGIVLFASVTNLSEAAAAVAAGIDAVIAQGYEAGGHRGLFYPSMPDDRLSVAVLTRILVRELHVPVISAGGIMDGAGIASVLQLGAAAAQLGTAFIACPESAADQGYLDVLRSDAAFHTVMTSIISGRPARCLPNRFTALENSVASEEIPSYPRAYHAAKSLHTLAKGKSEFGYGAQWAGQGAPLARSMPAAELIKVLAAELQAANAP